MSDTNHLDLMMEAFTELMQEERKTTPPAAPKPALPTLASVLADSSPLPEEALYLGQAEDGLPVLLNLEDPVPGPILITADAESGKTRLLQTIAAAADEMHPPERVQYVIVTPRPGEWQPLLNGADNAGVYDTRQTNAAELLQALVTWAHNNKGQAQTILLLIDDLPALTELDDTARQNLRWLLLRGTSRRVWCFVTLNAGLAHSLPEWLPFFRTRLFGRMENTEDSRLLTGAPRSKLRSLIGGTEFAMREGDSLLSFWLPSIE